MCSSLANGSKVGNVHSPFQSGLVWSIKDGIQRNVLEDLVDSELMRVEDHGGIYGGAGLESVKMCGRLNGGSVVSLPIPVSLVLFHN